MKFQFSLGHLALLTMLAAGTVTFPAAAEDRAPEPPLKSREAKTGEGPAGNSTPTAAKDATPESPEKSRDAKTTSGAKPVDMRIEGARNGLQIRVEPKEGAPPLEGGENTPCTQDCEGKEPTGSNKMIARPFAPQEVPGKDLGAPTPLTVSEADGARQRLGHALGIGGIVAAALGSYLTIGAIAAGNGTPTEVISGRNGFFFAGLACIGIGGGLVVGGFSLAAANHAPSTAVDRMPPVATRRGPADMGVSLTGSF